MCNIFRPQLSDYDLAFCSRGKARNRIQKASVKAKVKTSASRLRGEIIKLYSPHSICHFNFGQLFFQLLAGILRAVLVLHRDLLPFLMP